MQPVNVVFDIGGTKTRVATVAGGHTLNEIKTFETSPDPEIGFEKLVNTVCSLIGDFPVGAICGGVPGTVDNNVLVSAHNLPKWAGMPIAERLFNIFNAPVKLFNDAELVALGEYYYGAGKGEKDMLYVTVSTGVGGAHIVNGKIDKGRYNAEIGHQMVNRAELEDQISGTAVAKKYNVHPKDLSDQTILNELADTLAKGLYDNVLHWSPEAIVLGGSMIVGKNAIPIERVEKTLTAMVKKYYPEAPRILKAKLADQGGLYGGLACLSYSL